MNEKLPIPTTHDDELGIMNAPVIRPDGNAPVTHLNGAADASGAPTPDDASATPLGTAGAMMRALAADDTDNDG